MKPVAKQGDRVVATDTHLCHGAPTPLPFDGPLTVELSPDVRAEHRPVAVVGSVAINAKPHVPPPGKSFDVPPANRGVVVGGSATVLANHRPLARNGDAVETCNDPVDAPVGTVVAAGTVRAGG